MNLRTLGGLALEGASFHRPKPLLLLAYLTLEGPTERRHLAELFWMDAANARRSLNVALSQLRSDAPGAIGSDHHHVWTDVPCDATQLLGAAEDGNWLRTVELYHGPFLDGFEEAGSGLEIEEWIYRTRELLAHNVCTALLALGESAAAAGDFREAGTWATRAEAVARAAPLAPHDLGRFYSLLLAANQVPLGPWREECMAFGLELPASVQEARDRLRSAKRPVPTESLPSRTTSFVGRLHELEQLSRLLEDPTARLLSLIGAGGTGKTRLALQLASEEAGSGRWSAVHFVSLEPLRHADEVADAIAATLGIRLKEPSRGVDEIRHALGSSRTLLVLDNFEHLLTAAPLLVQLIRGCTNLRLVVTSRERLNVDEEHSILLKGLSVPISESVSAGDALRHDAVSLFTQRARQSRPDFTLQPALVAAVVRICQLVGGLPLAIEMAASWSGIMSSAEIADEIAKSLDVLESPSRDLPERHKSIRVAFEGTWQLLSAEEQRVMRALTAFRGGFSKEAAAGVASIGLSRLRTLVDRSLLSWNGVGRYELHPLLHQFLNEKASLVPDEAAEMRERHAAYFLERVAAHRDSFPHKDAGRAIREIEADVANILTGWEWAAENERRDLLEGATNPLGWFFSLQGRPVQGRAWSDIPTHAEPESILAARQLLWKAAYMKDFGFLQEAVQRLEHAAYVAERLGARADLALILRITGMTHLQRDPPDGRSATAVFRRALALHEELGDAEGIAMMLNNLAPYADDPVEARRMLEHGLQLARQAGETHAIAKTAETLAEFLAWSLGEYEAARAIAAESLACHEETGFSALIAEMCLLIGEMRVFSGDPAEVETYARRALEFTDSFQGGRATAVSGGALALQGQAERLRGGMDRAVEFYHRALQLIRDIPTRWVAVSAIGASLNGLARIALEREKPDEAREHATRAVEYLTRHETGGSFFLPAMRIASLVLLGEALMLERRNDEAEDRLQDALRLGMQAQQVPAILEALLAVGKLRHQQDEVRPALAIARKVAAHPASSYEVAERAKLLLEKLPPNPPGNGAIEPTLEGLVAAAAEYVEAVPHLQHSDLDFRGRS